MLSNVNPNYFSDLDSKTARFDDLGDFDIHTIEAFKSQDTCNAIKIFIDRLTKKYNRFFEPSGDFTNIIICADSEEYTDYINQLFSRNINIKLIRSNNYETQMPTNIQYFNIDYLVGLSLGLSTDEL
jgi:hypothetical protein